MWSSYLPPVSLKVPMACHKNVICVSSGLLFAFSYLITYTCARTLGSRYNYSSLKIGLVLLSFGIGRYSYTFTHSDSNMCSPGSIGGSVLGGRFSDHELARRTAANGGKTFAEVNHLNTVQQCSLLTAHHFFKLRLKSNIYTVFLFPPFILGFGWVCARHVHVSAICVMLFFCGFFSMYARWQLYGSLKKLTKDHHRWIYASTLAYIVDANTGRSSTAVAMNSAFRGVSAFTAVEIAVPMQVCSTASVYVTMLNIFQDKLGDGRKSSITQNTIFMTVICQVGHIPFGQA